MHPKHFRYLWFSSVVIPSAAESAVTLRATRKLEHFCLTFPNVDLLVLLVMLISVAGQDFGEAPPGDTYDR